MKLKTALDIIAEVLEETDGGCSQPFRCSCKENANDKTVPRCPYSANCEGRVHWDALNTLRVAVNNLNAKKED
jgi:hypothetical protein